MALKPGRPSEGKIEDLPRQFVREHKFLDGVSHKWHYDLDQSPNGPILVEMFYPEGYFPDEESVLVDPTSESLPKTKRMYLNPINGKLVGYTRAKMLKLID